MTKDTLTDFFLFQKNAEKGQSKFKTSRQYLKNMRFFIFIFSFNETLLLTLKQILSRFKTKEVSSARLFHIEMIQTVTIS